MVNEQSRNNTETIIEQSLDNHWTLVKFLQNRKAFIIRYLRKVYFFTFKVLMNRFVNLFHPSKYLVSCREKREVSQSFQRRILMIYSVSEIVHIAHIYHIFSQ